MTDLTLPIAIMGIIAAFVTIYLMGDGESGQSQGEIWGKRIVGGLVVCFLTNAAIERYLR